MTSVYFFVNPAESHNHYNPMVKSFAKARSFEFIGDHKTDSIVIGNYGDAKITAIGNFNLSGIIYCGKNTIEFNMAGEGAASFTGVCKKLMIRGMDGNCTLDLSRLSADIVWCESIKGNSVIILGPTRLIELINLDNEAVVKYEGKPLLLNYSLRGNSKILGWKENRS
jgi:hypothetical protein